MKIKRTIPLLAPLALAGVLAAVAPAAPPNQASLVIKHQTRGCHSWALNRGEYRTTETVVLSRRGSINVTNNDVMPHKIVKTSGPAVVYTRINAGTRLGLKGTFPPAMLARMHAVTKISFAKAGLYHFTTKAGEDYMTGIRTVGDDNVLRLTVRVS